MLKYSSECVDVSIQLYSHANNQGMNQLYHSPKLLPYCFAVSLTLPLTTVVVLPL